MKTRIQGTSEEVRVVQALLDRSFITNVTRYECDDDGYDCRVYVTGDFKMDGYIEEEGVLRLTRNELIEFSSLLKMIQNGFALIQANVAKHFNPLYGDQLDNGAVNRLAWHAEMNLQVIADTLRQFATTSHADVFVLREEGNTGPRSNDDDKDPFFEDDDDDSDPVGID